MKKKKFSINPFKHTVTIEGFNFISDREMLLEDFKQLCFEKGWEGTLNKIMDIESQIPEISTLVMKLSNYQVEI